MQKAANRFENFIFISKTLNIQISNRLNGTTNREHAEKREACFYNQTN